VRGYDAGRSLWLTGNGISTSIFFGETQYLFPSFVQRLVLRAGLGVAPFPRPDRGRAILFHGYDRL
jgi:hypothetical protein